MSNFTPIYKKYRNKVRALLVVALKDDIMNELLESKYQADLDQAVYFSLGRRCKGDDDQEWYAEKDRQMRLIFDDLVNVTH